MLAKWGENSVAVKKAARTFYICVRIDGYRNALLGGGNKTDGIVTRTRAYRNISARVDVLLIENVRSSSDNLNKLLAMQSFLAVAHGADSFHYTFVSPM